MAKAKDKPAKEKKKIKIVKKAATKTIKAKR